MEEKSKVLLAVADDHTLIRTALISLLEKCGFCTVAEGASGLELIKSIESASVLPDICILDLVMKDLDGYQTINILRQRWPSIKTIVYTMVSNEYSLVRMINRGARGYLLKGGKVEEIKKAILEVYNNGYYYPDLGNNTIRKDQKNLEKYLFNDKKFEFLKYCCTELTYKEIAAKMNVSLHTVDSYRNELFAALNIQSRVGLAMFAMSAGLVPF